MKKEEGKAPLSLANYALIEAVSRVRSYGIEKHGDVDGWKTTTVKQHYDALLRHVYASLEAEKERGDALFDEESGLLHLAHAACNIMFLIEIHKGEQNAHISRTID
jgi:hypothetical protein